MGEGEAIQIKNADMIEKAEIKREKGTNRAKFFRGQIDKYTWVNYGSSYLPSDLNAAYLWAQLEDISKIQNSRMRAWNRYYNGLKRLVEEDLIEVGQIPSKCTNNAHMFYFKVRNKLEEIAKLSKGKGYRSYIPLCSSTFCASRS